MRDEKKEMKFVEFYKSLYGDTSKATGTGELPVITKDHEEEHRQLWRKELTKILGGKKKANQTYKVRPYGKQSWLDYVFSWLRLGYGPTVVNDPDEGDPSFKEEKFNR